MELITVVANESDDGKRLDAVLASRTALARAQVVAAIQSGGVSVDGETATKKSIKVSDGQCLTVVPPVPEVATAVPQDIPLAIVYEDDAVVVVDKPAGMVVHPAAGHRDGTLVNALLFHCEGRLSSVGGVARPGIVHRLDKDTSGLMVCSKTDEAHTSLQAQFADHTVHRRYLALCARTSGPGLQQTGAFRTRHGRHSSDRKRFTGARGDRRAVTHYEVEERFRDGTALVRCRLETGRTHQIRMHLSEAGSPILGDPIYGGRGVAGTPLIGRAALHATTLGFRDTEGIERYFETPPPEDFQDALDRLRRGSTWRK